jgi:hypothetical protein
MDAYVYQAALWCEDCAKPLMAKLGQDPKFGSDHYPQGPYSDGGGEAEGSRPIVDHQRDKQIVETEVSQDIDGARSHGRQPGATLFASGVSPSLLNVRGALVGVGSSATEEAPMEPAGPRRAERRLAAILAADVAGYSRLMGADEEGTLERLKALRRELVDLKIAEHHGRIVKTTGDGMVEFASVVVAVFQPTCAAMGHGACYRGGSAEPSVQIPVRGS